MATHGKEPTPCSHHSWTTTGLSHGGHLHPSLSKRIEDLAARKKTITQWETVISAANDIEPSI
eukprot:CAMPEP_0180564360 /NCGR_PEP_ID=MMETSP1037_2-20121125/4969_1 /TAXON_ID=632150 /ORGANISM="Azadinium spinosum, Strain 3D9" /LENGTH=62 /DNA_ID=CAMNT_0022581255 /DNA_START=18 /DNA_END=206 /DNA_ORIENTATION=+